MNISEAQRIIAQQQMLAAELPPEVEFRERLNSLAAAIVRGCSQLFAPGGSRIAVNETQDDATRVIKKENPGSAIVTAVKAAARELQARCLAYREPAQDTDGVLAGAQHVDECLTAFVAAVPQMGTTYYQEPIRTALAQIRAQLAPAPKKAAKA